MMTQHNTGIEAARDPEGSIFLFAHLTEQEFSRERFAMMLGRGDYQGMEFDEIEAEERELRLRLALTNCSYAQILSSDTI